MIGYGIMSGGGLLRYSAIKRKLAESGSADDVAAFVREVASAGQTCTTHGKLDDPIVLVEPRLLQIVVACPDCSGDDVRREWEAQGPGVAQ